MPNIGEAFTRPYQDAEKISADPAYGKIVCFCERVTHGELRDAFNSVIPPAGLDGLRRRTRVMNGRCQGFFCGAEVQTMLEDPLPPRRGDTPMNTAPNRRRRGHRRRTRRADRSDRARQ